MSDISAEAQSTDTDAIANAHSGLADGMFRLSVIALASLLIFLILYPIVMMIARALLTDGRLDLSAFGDVAAQQWFWPVIRNTVIAVGAGSIGALAIAGTFAWLNERTDASLGTLGLFLPLIPLLVPPVAMAAGWTFLASPRVGYINGLLSHLPFGVTVNVLSWPGLIFLYILTLVPYAYLIVGSALRNLDPSLEEASRVSGAGLLRTIRRISLPAIGPALIGAALLLVVVGFALYSIPVIVGTRAGIDILSVRLVRLMTFSFPPDVESAVVLGTFMTATIGILWFFQRRVTGTGRFAVVSGRSRTSKLELGRWRTPARALMVGYLLLTSVLPLIGLVLVAFQSYWTPDFSAARFTFDNFRDLLLEDPVARKALTTSVSLGVFGGAGAMVFAVLMTIFAHRSSHDSVGANSMAANYLGRSVDGLSKLPAAFSNIVIAIGFVVAFAGAPFRLGGTVLILLLCYLVIYMPQASIAADAARLQVGAELSEASAVSGATWLRTTRKIVLPLMLPGVASGWALVFVLMAGDLAASALLASTGTPVVGFLIVQIWEFGSFGQMAVLGTTITAISSGIVLLIMLLTRQRFRARS